LRLARCPRPATGGDLPARDQRVRRGRFFQAAEQKGQLSGPYTRAFDPARGQRRTTATCPPRPVRGVESFQRRARHRPSATRHLLASRCRRTPRKSPGTLFLTCGFIRLSRGCRRLGRPPLALPLATPDPACPWKASGLRLTPPASPWSGKYSRQLGNGADLRLAKPGSGGSAEFGKPLPDAAMRSNAAWRKPRKSSSRG